MVFCAYDSDENIETFVHFKNKYLCTLFKNTYTYNYGHTCCSGKGTVIRGDIDMKVVNFNIKTNKARLNKSVTALQTRWRFLYQRKKNAVKTIQKNWIIVRYDPNYKMCGNVLMTNLKLIENEF